MIRVVKSPSKMWVYLNRLFHDNYYNENRSYFFTLEDYRRLMMIEELLKPQTGKYMKIKHSLLINQNFDQLSGCVVSLRYTLDNTGFGHIETNQDWFYFGSIKYYVKPDGIYTESEINPLTEKIKKRNKLENSLN